MSVMDIFRSDAFSLTSLTAAIDKAPYKPSRIGQMGLFETEGVPSLSVMIEEQDGMLTLLPTAPRGTQATPATGSKRKARTLAIQHIPYDDAVLASDVQGVRAFGSDNELETVSGVVAKKLAKMRQSHEVTLEWHRMGAVHGTILDADSTTIYDLFTEFGMAGHTQPGTREFGEGQGALTVGSNGQHSYAFAFSDPTTNIRAICTAIKRDIEKTLGGAGYGEVHAFCGSHFFDTLIDHDDVRQTYLNWQNAEALRNDQRKGFSYGGIVWEDYTGTVGGQTFQNTDTAIIFPVGVPELFKTYFGPADFVETVNTIGQPIYAKQVPMEFDRGIKIHTQSNPLCICTRPLSLIAATMS